MLAKLASSSSSFSPLDGGSRNGNVYEGERRGGLFSFFFTVFARRWPRQRYVVDLFFAASSFTRCIFLPPPPPPPPGPEMCIFCWPPSSTSSLIHRSCIVTRGAEPRRGLKARNTLGRKKERDERPSVLPTSLPFSSWPEQS